MEILSLFVAFLLAGFAYALPAASEHTHDAALTTRAAARGLPRLVIYYQTTHDSSGNPISMLPLINQQNISLTHLVVAAFHMNLNSIIHLNDYAPSDPHFYTLWNETAIMQAAGVTVTGMVGGAAPGSFSTSTLDSTNDTTFDHYYTQLRDLVRTYNLQGLDLDVEQSMSQAGIERLISRLAADFGPDFLITLAPVASALQNGANLSGFNYNTLQADSGGSIAFLNAQFYNGFGTLSSPSGYEAVVNNGFKPAEVVAGQLTTGGGTTFPTLNQTVITLRDTYGDQFGGIMGWEYFNGDPGGTAAPWEWAQEMTAILRPDDKVQLRITRENADVLTTAWQESVIDTGALGKVNVPVEHVPTVDYYAMVNA